jgi:acyl-coenzyme A thioesterase PaaI-like protein
MPLVALDNDGWGFTTNCFVCEPRNEAGLRIPFFHDTERSIVVADFELDDRFSGAPSWAHGGVSLAICDEAMAWAVIAIHHRWAVTKTASASFERPVRIGKRYRVEARVARAGDDQVDATAQIASADSGRVCVSSDATMAIVSEVQAPAMGIDVTDAVAAYLRRHPSPPPDER